MTSLIRIPFADSGDKSAVPETDATGGVNMTQGYGQAYSLDPATDPSAKRIEREMMNGLFNLITAAISEMQAAGVTPFITEDDNDGTAFSYGKGAMTILGGVVYQSLEDANTTTPPGAKWATLANLSNALSRQNPFGDIKADGTVNTALANLGLGNAVRLTDFTRGTGWVRFPDGTIIQYGTLTGLTSGSAIDVTLPIAFPNQTNQVVACHDNVNQTNRPTVYAVQPKSGSRSAIQGSAVTLVATTVGSAVTRESDAAPCYGRYLAIGR